MSKDAHGQAGRWIRSETGNSATEFALIMPMLAVLLFGFYEVGRLIWSYSIVASSVRDASRFASRLSMNCGGFVDGADTARVQRLTRTGTVDTGGTPLVKNWSSDASVTVAIDCIDNTGGTYTGRFDGLTQIPRVTVTAVAPYPSAGIGLVSMLNVANIRASHAEVWTQ
jgi:Flp pilus assembly protein TadG